MKEKRNLNNLLSDIGIDINVGKMTAEQRYGFVHVLNALDKYNSRYGIFITEYYINGKTQAQVAEVLGVSKSRIGQLKIEVVKKAQHPMYIKWITEGISLNK